MASDRIAPQGAGADDCNSHDIVWLHARGGQASRSSSRLARRLTATLSLGLFLTVSAQSALAPAAVAHTAGDVTVWATLSAPAHIPLPELAITLRPDTEEAKVEPHKQEASLPAPAADIKASPALGPDPDELLAFGPMRIKRWIVETVVRAGEATGVDSVYLMALADKESSFLPDNKARTSSAEGLFQFVEKTWLEVVRDFGARHGLASAAAAIRNSGGHLSIEDEATREAVLNLRRDPYLSAVMAAEMKKRDREKVERRIGRDLNRPEFYLTHFMGAQGAARMLEALSDKPKQRAAQVFPKAAKSNPGIFFSRDGRRTRGLSVAEVYERIDRMIDSRLDRYEGVTEVKKPVGTPAALSSF
jgi:hypothetical protein